MQSTKTLLIIGIVFLACGTTFCVVYLTTRLAAIAAIGPVFVALGAAFVIASKRRGQRAPGAGGS